MVVHIREATFVHRARICRFVILVVPNFPPLSASVCVDVVVRLRVGGFSFATVCCNVKPPATRNNNNSRVRLRWWWLRRRRRRRAPRNERATHSGRSLVPGSCSLPAAEASRHSYSAVVLE